MNTFPFSHAALASGQDVKLLTFIDGFYNAFSLLLFKYQWLFGCSQGSIKEVVIHVSKYQLDLYKLSWLQKGTHRN